MLPDNFVFYDAS